MMTPARDYEHRNGRAERRGTLGRGAARGRLKRSKARVDSRPVERVLPALVLAEMRVIAAGADKITTQLVAELDERFDVAKRHGVTQRRLRNYLTRVRQDPSEPVSAASGEHKPGLDEETSWQNKLSAHRRRQVSVAEILDNTFGRFAESKPELWEHRAYLMLVGQVYERLATSEDELSTDELIKLGKALAENRRVDARVRDDADGKTEDDNCSVKPGEMPESLAKSVRQIYGTDLAPIVRSADGDAR